MYCNYFATMASEDKKQKLLSGRLLVVATSIAILVGGVGATSLVYALKRRPIITYKCDSNIGAEYIVSSEREYMIANPNNSWSENTYLVSNDIRDMPKNWLYYGLVPENINSSGFKLISEESNPWISELAFDARDGTLGITYRGGGEKFELVACRKTTEIKEVAIAANNVPIEYLSSRVGLINPSYGDKEFNLMLYKVIKDRKNSYYGVYKLLSSLNSENLTGEEIEVMKNARDVLIDKNSDQTKVWEYNNTFRFNWEQQYRSERGEADKNAGNWCRNQQRENTSIYTSKGYRIIDSRPQEKESGKQTQRYPDGRYSGYVNYWAFCDGTLYTLKKEGGVDSPSGNTSRG